MKKLSLIKAVGFMGAVILIVFGSLGNFLRTTKLAWVKLNRR